MNELNNRGKNPQIIMNVSPTKESNGVGTAGFVLALIALFFSWVPVLGWIVWFLGLILSAVGLAGKPKGLAAAGLVISLIGLIILIVIIIAASGQ
jgi:hypothetical protein